MILWTDVSCNDMCSDQRRGKQGGKGEKRDVVLQEEYSISELAGRKV